MLRVYNLKKLSAMKRIIFLSIILILISGLVFSFTFLENENRNNNLSNVESIKDTIQPKEDIKVNKKFDENGNLIQYDSTYTYSYSSNGELESERVDSLFESMNFGLFNLSNDTLMRHFPGTVNSIDVRKQMEQIRKHFGFPEMNGFFSEDPFNTSPFGGFFDSKSKNSLELFQLMDSLQNQFFNNQIPPDFQKQLNKQNKTKKISNSSII